MNIKILPRLLLALFVIAICVWQIFPLDKKIRLGKDLRGGVSMVYSVAMPPTGDSQRVLAQVVESLKRRVNPQGVLDISLQPQGADRIDVVMPLPSPEVRALGDNYRTKLTTLGGQMTITSRELDQALSAGTAADLAPAPSNGAAAGLRRTALTELQAAFNDATSARIAYQAAIAQNASASDIAVIEDKIAKAEVTQQTLIASIAATNIDEAKLKSTFGLLNVRAFSKDAKGNVKIATDGTRETVASPREVAVNQLKIQLPDFALDIDALSQMQIDYASKVTGYDDPEDLKRLLRGAGVLEFHIAVGAATPEGVNPDEMRKQLAERGPAGTDSPVARWFPINDPKQWGDSQASIDSLMADPASYLRSRDMVGAKYDGVPYALLYVTDAMSLDHLGGRQWTMKNVFPSKDQLGREAVAFQLDPAGGQLMGRLTGANIGRPMGIVLDGQLFSAPNLQSQISNSGQITGSFSNEEIQYLVRVLQGGELEAKLRPEPLSVSILGPALGADNLSRGLWAVAYSAIATAVLMALYYFGAGLVADVAVFLNVAMIFGIMAMIDGTFTLPGLAGIALVIGMAVDANVLIFERTREELIDNKEPLKNALTLGYSRAFNAIFDGNVTHLIVSVVLYKLAATEVKGFALTMMIGVVTTLFTALFCTRVMYAILVNWFGMKRMPMLPTVFPPLMKALRPSINWLRYRWIFWGASAAVAVICIGLCLSSGRAMLETEFRGGVTMTLMTRKAAPGEVASAGGRLVLNRDDVERRVHEIGEKSTDAVIQELRVANVLTVGESTPDGGSTGFQIKVSNPAELDSGQTVTETLLAAVAGAFQESLDIGKPVRFTGSDDAEGVAHSQAITSEILGDSIGDPTNKASARDFVGGVAIVLKNLEPPLTLEDAEARIARMRKQPDFTSISGRPTQVLGLHAVDPANAQKGWTSIVILVTEPSALLTKVDAATWDRVVAKPEWQLVQAAFTSKLSLDQVSSFSPVVAANLAASAIMAIIVSLIGMILYIWLRFSSFRYSLATIVAVAFNIVVCLGALSLSLRLEGTEFANLILLKGFRIDLNVIAGLLTIIGYSLNDTIVILDRIREIKGKRQFASWKIVNTAINQTFSRTIMTGGVTLVSAGVLYIYGGPAIQPFAFTFIVGLLAGTVSSVVIAAPLTFVSGEDHPVTDTARIGSGGVVNPTPA